MKSSLRALASERPMPAVFGALCVVAMLGRVFVLFAPGVPAGIDGGGWLAYGRDLLGGPARLGQGTYPPLVPTLVSGVVGVFGPTLGMSLVGAAAAAAPSVGTFVLLRLAGLGWTAVALSASLLASTALGEVTSWGGYPQLLAAPAVVLGWWWLDRWLERGNVRDAAGTMLAAVAVLGTSHFAAMPAALGAVVIAAWRSAIADDRVGALRRLGVAGGLVALSCLPLLFIYSRLVPAALGSRGAEPALAGVSWTEMPARFAAIHGATWPIWAVGLGMGTWAVLVRRGPVGRRIRIVTAGFQVGIFGGFVVSGEPRLLYEVPAAAAIGVGAWLLGHPARRRTDRIRTAGLALAVVLILVGGISGAIPSRDRYQVLDPGLQEAITWIGATTPPGARIGVPSLEDAPLGWWVEGLTGRPTVSGAPLRWLIFPEERRLAAAANRLFFVTAMPSDGGMGEARALGLDFVLLPTSSIAYDPTLARDYLARHPPAFESGGALVLAVPGSTSTPEAVR